jgi:hypothetical protein
MPPGVNIALTVAVIQSMDAGGRNVSTAHDITPQPRETAHVATYGVTPVLPAPPPVLEIGLGVMAVIAVMVILGWIEGPK